MVSIWHSRDGRIFSLLDVRVAGYFKCIYEYISMYVEDIEVLWPAIIIQAESE